MLPDLINIFKKEYDKYGEKFISDEYIPSDGEYIIVDEIGNDFKISKSIEIKKDKKNKKIDRSDFDFDFISKADYLSMYLNSNKSIFNGKVGDASGKNIHSNNYLTFFVKKEKLREGHITIDLIDKYYDILKDPLAKYDKNQRELYIEFENQYGNPDKEKIERIQKWVKSNLFNLVKEEDKSKSYLKLFFRYNIDDYMIESNRYTLINIFNSAEYNIEINNQIHGLSNDNMGLNTKKPFLENKTRKSKLPYLVSTKDILIQKKFFDWLKNQANLGKNNIYISNDEDENEKIKSVSNEILDKDFTGYYLRIKKGKEIEIHDFDTVENYTEQIKPLIVNNVLENSKSDLEYSSYYKRQDIKNLIEKHFFYEGAKYYYFSDKNDISFKQNFLKRNYLISRITFFNWFYKGDINNVEHIIEKISLNLAIGFINEGNLWKARDIVNLRFAFKNYFKGDDDMDDVLQKVKSTIRDKINQKETSYFKDDNEYFFAIGQITYYFISLTKTKNKVHSLANPIINCKSNEAIRKELSKFYKKYNYNIDINSKRFKNLYAMILSYSPKSKINQDLIIAGYLHSNLIYEKNNKEEEKNG